MKAAVLTRPKHIDIVDAEEPDIKDNEIKIKVEGCGVCASSIPVWEGRDWFTYPLAAGSPGHEGWGVIKSVGSNVKSFSEGDKVAYLSFNSYAEYDAVDEASAVKLPASFNKPFPGEPLGCAMNIFKRSDIKKGDTVAIIGIGFLGALLCQLAYNAGAKVIAISKRNYSLEFAKKYGADEIIPLTATWEVANKVEEITKNNFCSRVIEATGKQEAIDIATEIVSEGGKIIIAGYHQDGLRQVNMQKWNWKGIDVINAHERDPLKYLQGMKDAMNAVENGVIDPELLYTNFFPLEEINKGFELTATRPDGFMKALIKMKK